MNHTTVIIQLTINLFNIETGNLPDVFGGLVNLNFLNLLSNKLTGKLSENMCEIGVTFLYLDPSVCYPYCLSSAVQVYDQRTLYPTNRNTTRCQSPEDLAMCAISVQTNIHAKLSQATFDLSICTPYNYSACQNTNLNFVATVPGQVVNVTEFFQVPGAIRLRVYFNVHTDQIPDLLLFCTSSAYSSCIYNFTNVPLNGLPGIKNTPALEIEGSQFYLRYMSFSCGSLTYFNTACWGYQIFVDAVVSYRDTGGWLCSSPPSAAVAIYPPSDPFWSTSVVPYDQSYAGNFNSWYGVTTAEGIINGIDFSSYFISISGQIPDNIGYLRTLQSLNLNYNNFTGIIPSSFSLLTELRDLSLSFNFFTGSLKPLSTLTNLQFLSASSNLFSGEIPYKILAAIPSADISSNSFTGQLPTSLCNLTLTNLNVAGNPFSCYPSCLQSRVQDQTLVVGSIGICSPSSAPTSAPVASNTLSSQNVLGLALGIGLGLPLFLILLGTVVYLYWRKSSVKYLRKERLRFLPVHKSIVKQMPAEEVMKRISNNSETISQKDYDGLTAFDLAVDPRYERQDSQEQQEIVLKLVENILPVHPEFKSQRSIDQHGFLWSRIVQSDRHTGVVNEIIDLHRDIAHELAYTVDREGRPVLNIASPLNQFSIRQSLYFLKRYEFITPVENPYHKSGTCMLLIGIDHHSKEMGDGVPDQKVALKFMLLKEQFLNEVNIRKKANFDSEYVISILSVYDGESDGSYRRETVSKNIEQFKYAFTMPCADKNLSNIITSERIAGKDWAQIKLIALNVATALGHVHTKGYIHGDMKPLNIVRLENKYKLIDFDASAEIGIGCSGYKYSSAYSPPELIHEEKGDSYSIKSFFVDPVTLAPITEDLSYSLVPASPAHDIWSLGVILYELCSGMKLFLSDDEDNMDEMELKMLYEFTDEFKKRKLLRVHDMMARNLLAQLLTKDPLHRPRIEAVLVHPFISGGKATRMVGEQAEFDVFLSYRVRSDADHALKLYELLTKRGIKVWLDVKCLEPGVSWEQGFADGLVKSRVFVPILSRRAINDNENISCDFTRLTENSSCDNVLLEYILALEFHQRELVERIYPVMIGDFNSDYQTYGKYFVDGCHPRLEGNVTVHSVETQVEYHLNRLRLGSPLLSDMTVAGVCKEVVSKQGKLVEGPQDDALSATVDDIEGMVQILLNRDRLHLDSIANKMKKFAKRIKEPYSPSLDTNSSALSASKVNTNISMDSADSHSESPDAIRESKNDESVPPTESDTGRGIELGSAVAATSTPEVASSATELIPVLEANTLTGIDSSQLVER